MGKIKGISLGPSQENIQQSGEYAVSSASQVNLVPILMHIISERYTDYLYSPYNFLQFSQDFSREFFSPVFTRIFSREKIIQKIPVNFSSRFLTSSLNFSRIL